MSIDKANEFIERMRDDKKFRDKFLSDYAEMIKKLREKAGYDFTENELREARRKIVRERKLRAVICGCTIEPGQNCNCGHGGGCDI